MALGNEEGHKGLFIYLLITTFLNNDLDIQNTLEESYRKRVYPLFRN